VHLNEQELKQGLDETGLPSAAFVTALAHFYRGEMYRANIWRTRLDVTTNWAIITTAAFLSFGFGSREIPHFVIILATIFVFFFLIIESRRYKYFDLWRWRVALVNENFFAPLLSSEIKPLHANWRRLLSHDLQQPQFKTTFHEAFGRRLRRNYIWIFGILDFCWVTKVAIHPMPVTDVMQFMQRAGVYHLLPGSIVIGVGVIFNLVLVIIAFLTRKERGAVVRISPANKSTFQMSNF